MGGFVAGFIIPILIVFYIIQLSLNKTVLLRAVFELDREVAGKVVEEAKEEKVDQTHRRTHAVPTHSLTNNISSFDTLRHNTSSHNKPSSIIPSHNAPSHYTPPNHNYIIVASGGDH